MKISYDFNLKNQENDCVYLINRDRERNLLKIFDPKTYLEAERTFDLSFEDFYIPDCQNILIDKEIFCFGNRASFILNIETLNTVLIIKDWLWNCDLAGIAYLNNCIYLFLLVKEISSYSCITEKYDLASHRWTKVANCPLESAMYFCLTFRNNILIYNHSPTIFQYDENINSYSILFEMVKDSSKIIVSGNSKLFIIESKGRIYESDAENQYKFIYIGDSNINFDFIKLSLANFQNDIYFGLITRNYFQRTYSYSYYRLGLKEKRVEKINTKIWNCYIN
ncbi:unnamed protein product [Blepharisma stoltei]|uniref:Uncharacterized protein n=1 Tax=Blepharisma stoltei TaxID=1481888 RepID=A0AAU9JAW4_9CILI|nr:unnamed protein product [Blepharisma stoltei]